MSPLVRKILFWTHLVSGLVAGLVIALMSVTGVAIAFEKQILERADRSARQFSPPQLESPRLPVDELLARARADRPGAQPVSITVYRPANERVLVSTGRTSGVYVEPFTGEVTELGAPGLRKFFQTMTELHRWLATSNDHRAIGKAITGVSNTAFLLLALTGLYIWWPKRWTKSVVRQSLWFRRGLKAKARDWNWHNTIGFWSLPVLIVLTTSGMVISFKWASDLVYRVAGEPPPAAQGAPTSPPVRVEKPSPDAAPASLEALFARAREESPESWETISLRLPAPQRPVSATGTEGSNTRAPGSAPDASGSGSSDASPPAASAPPSSAAAPSTSAMASTPSSAAGSNASAPASGGRGGPTAMAFTVRTSDRWPLFASETLSLNPFSAEVLRSEGYADFSAGRKTRMWMRYLHTGEALGWLGQLVAMVASLGAVFLVYTGFALAWRRFFPRRQRTTETVVEGAVTTDSNAAA